MADLINFKERQMTRDADASCITSDPAGRRMFKFSIVWSFAGSNWINHIWAYDWDDAEARVLAMRNSITVDGQVCSEGTTQDLPLLE